MYIYMNIYICTCVCKLLYALYVLFFSIDGLTLFDHLPEIQCKKRAACHPP